MRVSSLLLDRDNYLISAAKLRADDTVVVALSIKNTVMGVDVNIVGYLHYCSEEELGESDLEKMDVRGQNLSECIRPFKVYSAVEEQYQCR